MSIRRRLITAALAGTVVLAVASPVFALDGRVVDARTGKPVARAEVTILGRSGAVYTDAEGRFSIKPDPVPPFEVLVILPGERFTKPVLIESLPADGPLEVRISSLVDESVTVTAGAAPDIEATSAAATSLIPSQEIVMRQPANLTQALESTAGVSRNPSRPRLMPA